MLRAVAVVLLTVCASIIVVPVFAQTDAQLISFWNDREAGSKIAVNHSQWQLILDRYLDDQHPSGINRFNYAAVTDADQQSLNAYISFLQTYEPRQFNAEEQMAYWINLYNAATVLLIVAEDSSIGSIRELRSGIFTPGPWRRKFIKISGQELSLDDVEHGILRPIWKDNRVHYVLNCASLSCPNLPKTAFTGQNVEALLELAAIEYINHPRGVRIEGGRLFLSSIYDWYRQDFGSEFADLIAHLVKYIEPEMAVNIQKFNRAEYSYDWALNRP
ncbi:MAG: hypothetical protein ACI8XV_000732 [Arenicella sp.]|jgi:hypothetical protein